MLKRVLARFVLAALLVAAVVLVMRRAADRSVVFHSSSGTAVEGKSAPPNVAHRPVPVSPDFEGCPATGDGGDRQLNILKNRVDTAAWPATSLGAVLGLTWPPNVTRRVRTDWSRRDSITIAKNEGRPVSVEGYLVASKQEGPEATNCHGAASTFRDWHLWLSATPGKDRRHSIVVEATPAVRAQHPEWSLGVIRKLVRDSTPVRVSGWLLFDQEHPEQLGKTRGTLWEIHPIMRIEVMRDGKWTELRVDSVGQR
jgi:hypothetical protein